jgi:hypothetical protein
MHGHTHPAPDRPLGADTPPIGFRIVTLSFATLLAAYCVWLLAADLISPPITRAPRCRLVPKTPRPSSSPVARPAPFGRYDGRWRRGRARFLAVDVARSVPGWHVRTLPKQSWPHPGRVAGDRFGSWRRRSRDECECARRDRPDNCAKRGFFELNPNRHDADREA